MTDVDVVIVGSGINSLVCGALLARRGKRVCILERSETLGGCIRTEELTLPGFKHDTLSTLYPLFTSAPHFATLEQPLARHGAIFVNGKLPTAVVRADGAALVFSTDREQNVAALEQVCHGDGDAYRRAMHGVESCAALTFGLLGGEPLSGATARLLTRHAWGMGLHGLSNYFADALLSCRAWLQREFRSELARALFAPWVLHVGLGPESAASSLMCRLVMLTLEQFGSPMVAGGSANLATAFATLIRNAGGELHTGADVAQVQIVNGVARGVRLVDGRTFGARTAVVCNVTPTQLYGRLVASGGVPMSVHTQAHTYRYGRAEMQIHLALDEPPRWPTPQLAEVAMLHVTEGLNSVSRAVNEAERGLLPAEATIVVAQPHVIDPSRAPAGKAILWIQLQELPSCIRGDAVGEIASPADGRWTDEVRERYADRIVERLCRLVPNLRRSICGRSVISPADLESLNMNLVGGDPYSGACEIDQFLLWRPFPGVRGHRTPIRGLYHIGASTHPGPGLGGMSGALVAGAIG